MIYYFNIIARVSCTQQLRRSLLFSSLVPSEFGAHNTSFSVGEFSLTKNTRSKSTVYISRLFCFRLPYNMQTLVVGYRWSMESSASFPVLPE